ncbi:hypothetical protein BOQ62_04985 [Chryseobacterium sp. CH21]|uniref:MAC/perforin domain-containing protein n=1 Tax=Chryseobacterium sp. CH21 TaxID=713556 RepID=UPI00100A4BA7|nr:MAC/perforin domain-containing protein [Chryseobacterium sp. CH21]RXM40671.1 hypothetical protein BOQ62_04985 [Chryseobacterium sp. CH21]
MVKKIVCSLFLSITLVNCSSEIISSDEAEPFQDKEKINRSVAKVVLSNNFNALGFGYDATGRYANIESTRLQVIDTEKFNNLDPGHMDIKVGTEENFEYTFGTNSVEYSNELTLKAGFSASLFKLFTAEVKSSFGSTEAYKGSMSLANATKYIIQKRLKLVSNNENLRNNYLSQNFIDDVNTLSPEALVNYYGTHVVTSAVLGAKFSISYQTQTRSDKKTEALAAGFAANALSKLWSANIDYSYNSSEAKYNYNQKVNYRSVGGDGTQALIGEIVLDNTTPVKLNINQWQSTCTLQNATLIDFGDTGLIPLYEFISDANKRAQVQSYITQYLQNNSTQISLDKVPIYRYFSANMNDHIYDPQANVISYDNTWVKEKVAFYGYNYPAPNTVAVYKYFIPSLNDHVYYTDPYLQFSDANVRNEGIIFYVPNQSVTGAKPVYKYYNSQMKDHIFELNPNITQIDNTWIRENIVFNAFEN